MQPLALSPVAHVLIMLIAPVLPAPQELVVQLKSGSVRTGQPDPSTNESQLRLRIGEPDAYVVFGIDWTAIEELRYGEEVWRSEDFAELPAKLAKSAQVSTIEPQPTEPEIQQLHGPKPSVRPLWQPPERPAPSERRTSLVQFIDVDGVAANWDLDPEWDGLVVRIWPMDQNGQVLRVPGTLTVTLFGESYRTGPYALDQLGNWVRPVHVSDYGPDGFSVRLEFQNRDPERWDAYRHPDHRIGPFGTVSASFAVPGHGVFQASTITPVRLRRFDPLRDRLLIYSGTRTLPSER